MLYAKEKETIRVNVALKTEAHMMFPGGIGPPCLNWKKVQYGIQLDNFQESPQDLLKTKDNLARDDLWESLGLGTQIHQLMLGRIESYLLESPMDQS